MKIFAAVVGTLLLVGDRAWGADIRGWEVKSPDGNVAGELALSPDGKLTYHVNFRGQIAIAESPLGIVRADQRFVEGLRFDAEKRDKISEDYTMPHGKRSHRHVEANELTLTFRSLQGGFLEVIFRVANDGVAFRYCFPETEPVAKTVTKEQTVFQLPARTKVWRQPYDQATMYTPAYERLFENGVAADATSTNGPSSRIRCQRQSWRHRPGKPGGNSPKCRKGNP